MIVGQLDIKSRVLPMDPLILDANNLSNQNFLRVIRVLNCHISALYFPLARYEFLVQNDVIEWEFCAFEVGIHLVVINALSRIVECLRLQNNNS